MLAFLEVFFVLFMLTFFEVFFVLFLLGNLFRDTFLRDDSRDEIIWDACLYPGSKP